ncbi:MAG: hypothetical protein V4591_09785, partial [Bdellovibrionota bacterium]
IQHPQSRREFTQKPTSKKIPTLYKSVRAEKQVKSVEEQRLTHAVENNLICDSRMYALKKRLLIPTWLLEGVLLVLGTKEPWFESIACSRLGKVFACPSNVNVKTLVPFFLVWHELVSKMFCLNSKETTIKLQINKYISGTKKDIYEISKEIENIFSSPLKLFEIKPAKKSKTFSMSKTGSLNFIRHAQLENDVDGAWLTLNLTNSFQEICYPPELKNSIHLESKNIVSISPIVIQSMGVRANLKKILNYLFLEFSKQESYSNNSNWNSFRIDCKKISHFHKDFLSTAPSFYDHGVLGWNNCAPNKKISDIKEMSKVPSHRHEIICSWQLSDQVKEAYEIENAISEKIMQQAGVCVETLEASLFPEPPEDELKKAREERQFKKLVQEKEQAAKVRNAEKKAVTKAESAPKRVRKKVVTQTLFDDGIVVKKSPPIAVPKPAPIPSDSFCKVQNESIAVVADNEFLVLVSEFYESLKPMQKRAFERDRKGMTREQFKAYMSSILQRKKPVHL